MLKKSITYTDFNGTERTEDFYFNLSKAEIATMQLTTKGGFDTYIEEIVNSNDGKRIVEAFKSIIEGAYGVKSDDGKRFLKSKELFADFEASEAYSQLFMELVTDPAAGATFVNGVMPDDLTAQAEQVAAQNGFRPGSPAQAAYEAAQKAARAAAQGQQNAQLNVAPQPPVQQPQPPVQQAPPAPEAHPAPEAPWAPESTWGQPGTPPAQQG